jgi:hypothetical protein
VSVDWREVICRAIAGRRVLRFRYRTTLRTVYPCAHGWLDTGNEALRAHEVRLQAGDLRVGFGKLFLLASMADVEITDVEFDRPPPGYRRGDRGMERIHCQL